MESAATKLLHVSFHCMACLKDTPIQWFKLERDLWTSLRKYLVLAEAETEAASEAEDTATADDADDDEEFLVESFELISLSSSLIVSNIFDVLCLITVTYCGGATSKKNLAILELAIAVNIFLGRNDIGFEYE